MGDSMTGRIENQAGGWPDMRDAVVGSGLRPSSSPSRAVPVRPRVPLPFPNPWRHSMPDLPLATNATRRRAKSTREAVMRIRCGRRTWFALAGSLPLPHRCRTAYSIVAASGTMRFGRVASANPGSEIQCVFGSGKSGMTYVGRFLQNG